MVYSSSIAKNPYNSVKIGNVCYVHIRGNNSQNLGKSVHNRCFTYSICDFEAVEPYSLTILSVKVV